MEDSQIIDLFFARSEEAIQTLSEKYGAICRRLSLNILRDPMDAEECVNDAYLAVWKTVPPAKPSPFLPYLCRIVRNLSIERYRKRRAAKRDDALTLSWDELEPCLPSAGSPEEETDARELTRLINRYLEGLTQQDQLLCLLKRKGKPRLCRGVSKSFSFKYRAKREKNSNVMVARKLIFGKATPVYGLPCK